MQCNLCTRVGLGIVSMLALWKLSKFLVIRTFHEILTHSVSTLWLAVVSQAQWLLNCPIMLLAVFYHGVGGLFQIFFLQFFCVGVVDACKP